jgi:hypothetical protein
MNLLATTLMAILTESVAMAGDLKKLPFSAQTSLTCGNCVKTHFVPILFLRTPWKSGNSKSDH